MEIKRFIADRMSTVPSSGIRRIFDLAATMENPIDFSIGQPDFPVPDAVKRAAIVAIEENRNGYTVTHGVLPLRDKISGQLAEEITDWKPTVVVTCGVSGGLTLTMLACLNPGDEVIIPDPYFVSYPHLVRMAGGTPVAVDTAPSFAYSLDRLEAAVTKRTKAILVNSPSNPTGVVYSTERIKEICAFARRHDLLIISDEIYNLLSFDETPATPVTYAPDRTVLLRGFGKSYGMTGWRMGYAAGPAEIIAEIAKLQQYTFVCAPHPFQKAGEAALDTDMSAVVAAYGKKRDLAVEILSEAFEFPKPAGGFFLYCRPPKRFETGTAFVEAAIKKNVLTVPGSAFSMHDTHFRISYAVPNDRLAEGCEILRKLAT
jgi:aspartate aminotransferase/aminotransferase